MATYKFIRVAKPANLKMVKLEVDGSEIWAECSDAVKAWASNNFKEGDVVEAQLSQVNGKYKVDGKISKEGQESAPAKTAYNKPYSKTPTTTTSANTYGQTETKKTWGKSPEECDSIKRQAIMHAVSRTIIGLQGHVDLNNVHDVAKELYATYQELVG